MIFQVKTGIFGRYLEIWTSVCNPTVPHGPPRKPTDRTLHRPLRTPTDPYGPLRTPTDPYDTFLSGCLFMIETPILTFRHFNFF